MVEPPDRTMLLYSFLRRSMSHFWKGGRGHWLGFCCERRVNPVNWPSTTNHFILQLPRWNHEWISDKYRDIYYRYPKRSDPRNDWIYYAPALFSYHWNLESRSDQSSIINLLRATLHYSSRIDIVSKTILIERLSLRWALRCSVTAETRIIREPKPHQPQQSCFW